MPTPHNSASKGAFAPTVLMPGDPLRAETAALYCNAAYLGRRALTLCSISDQLVTGERLSTEERQITFNTMVEIALDTAKAMFNKEG